MNETCPTCGGTGTVLSPAMVRSCRVSEKLTQQEVAKEMGCDNSYITRIEQQGRKESTPQARRRVYDAIMAIAARKRDARDA